MKAIKTNSFIILLTFTILSVSGIHGNPAEKLPLELVVQKGHNGSVYDIGFTQDSRIIISASSDGTIKLWDAATCHEIRTFVAWGRYSLSPDGKLIACFDKSRTSILIYELESGKQAGIITGHKNPITCTSFSPGSNYIASSSDDGKVMITPLSGKKSLFIPLSSTINPVEIIFSSDGEHLFILKKDGLVIKIKRSDGSIAAQTVSGAARFSALELSPDGAFIAAAASDEKIHIFKSSTLEDVTTLGPASPDSATSLSWSIDGKKIASISPDGDYIFFDIFSGSVIKKISIKGFYGKDRTAAIDSKWKMIASSNGFIWDVSTGEKIRTVKGYSRDIKKVLVSSDGKIVFSQNDVNFYNNFNYGNHKKTVKLWEMEGCSQKISFDNRRLLDISSSGNLIALDDLSKDERSILITSIPSGETVLKIPLGESFPIASFTPDGKKIACIIKEKIAIVDIESRKINYTMASAEKGVYHIIWNNDASIFAMCNWDSYSIWDAASGTEISASSIKNGSLDDIFFSPDGKLIYLSTVPNQSSSYTITAFSIPSLKAAENTLSGIKGTGAFVISPDGKKAVISTLNDGIVRQGESLKIFDIHTGREIRTLTDNSSGIKSLSFSGDGKILAAGGWDGIVHVWNLDNGGEVSFFCSADEWAAFTPDGYFDGSRSGGRIVAVVKGFEVSPIDQFSVYMNRPDIISERMGMGSDELISHLKHQHLKRLRKSGLKENTSPLDLHLPSAVIQSFTQDKKFLTVSFKLHDSRYPVTRYNVFINDVPLYGSAGKTFSGKTEGVITENLELTSGQNKIEISCINSMGAESNRALTYAEYRVPVKGNLYFIGFGISKFKDPSLNLEYADKDVKDLAEMFSGMKDSYSSVSAVVFTNEEVTVENIKNASKLLDTAGPDDTFVLFIAGHGVHDRDSESTYYYLTYNADTSNLKGTCANFELIENLLQNIAPRNKLFLMDTCESGEVDTETKSKFYTNAGARGIKARAARAITVIAESDVKQKTREYLYQKERYIYNDMLRRSGAIVFSSSRGGEFSYESSAIKNGYFTRAIIDALTGAAVKKEKGIITVDELRRYVSDKVPLDTGGLQHPTVDRDNLYQKFGFPVK